ncbi:hypothetical protein BEWA_030060 [Theileria equi strain WA]|uniref:Uncharacterized protein n=1 Tax=Theileria equi strain WA TaxID=1537102 RepID=L0AZ29_THEEQ|nr:hypothetical protein BEWA_030060 [Theileria equi strain WA]AFZ80154.1 hypothetical protein BEWA_030060 [Theileria equi strain WA]|eukprot:XP_004829820.1 hypothetical protein BEWA_030060 [Theileria equi strain WA]
MSVGELQLDINGKCSGECKCTKKYGEFYAERKAIPDVTNFTKYIHKLRNPNGRIFTLDRTLKNGGQIGVTGLSDTKIQNVTEVYVYYWDGAPTNPILLRVIHNNRGKPEYYGKLVNSNTWGSDQVDGLNEQQALDHQNCQHNLAIPIELTQPENLQQFHLGNSKSTCLKSASIIKSKQPDIPAGANGIYVRVGYKIDSGKRISRLTYKGQPTVIPPYKEYGPTLNIYSWKNDKEKPEKALLVEVVTTDTDKAVYYKNTGDDQWSPSINRNSKFRLSDEELEQKLDELICEHHRAVTIDLTKSYSDQYVSDGNYCCGEHKGRGKISVAKKDITVNDNKMTEYFKHTINTGPRLAAIKYYNEDDESGSIYSNRRRIRSSNFLFPMDGVKAVYAFYCQKNNPLLIYIEDGHQNGVTGWYQKDGDGTNGNEEWVKVTEFGSITPSNFGDLQCDQWTQLKESLREAGGCADLQDCHKADNLLQSELRYGEQESKQDEQPQEEENDLEDEEDAGPQVPTGNNGAEGTTTEELPPEHKPLIGELTTATIVGYVAAGTVTPTGLTGFAYWIYQRFNGSEPWVRQI